MPGSANRQTNQPRSRHPFGGLAHALQMGAERITGTPGADHGEMKRPSIIRSALLLGSASAAIWQAPRIIAMVDQVRAQGGLSGLHPAATFGGEGGKPAGAEDMTLDEIRSLISGASPTGIPAAKKAPGDVVIFTPKGARLSEQERQRLRRQAENLRPDLIPAAGGGPGEIGRVSLPPLAGPVAPPPTPAPTPAESTPPESTPPNPSPSEPQFPVTQPPVASPPHTPLQSAPPRTGDTRHEQDAEAPAQSASGGSDREDSDPLAGYGDGPPLGPVGIHDELRELLVEIAPPSGASAGAARHARRQGWRSTTLPSGSRPTFIIGPPGSASAPVGHTSP